MQTDNALTPEQKSDIQDAIAKLQTLFPEMSVKDMLTGPVAKEIFGRLPPYSGRRDYQLNNVTTAALGSFVICYGKHPVTHKQCILLTERGPLREDRHIYGSTGGYVNLDGEDGVGEQPVQGAVREAGEEIRDDEGRPILTLDPKQLILVKSGVDYKNVSAGGLPVQYTGHAARLTDEQMRHVWLHCERLKADSDYREACYKQTNYETLNVFLKPAPEIMQLGDDAFAYPHELEAVKNIAHYLMRRAYNSRKMTAPFTSLVM